jgi:protein-S-isoprenylcysteine O-methyltransferase Ste14
MWTLIRALVYATFFVGVLLVLIPSRVLSIAGIESPKGFGLQQGFGVAVVLTGAALGLWCILSFVFIGKGTQAPFDAPRQLVIRGPYRVIRNPMYLGATATLAGAALYYGSTALSIYAIAFWVATHCGVIFLEEPDLTRTFGNEYEAYRSRVGRWFPRLGNTENRG